MKELYQEKQIFERTQVWAQGMEQWASLSSVPQFRWTLCGSSGGNTLYNFSELCAVILDLLIQMCSFFPSRLGLPYVVFNLVFIIVSYIRV